MSNESKNENLSFLKQLMLVSVPVTITGICGIIAGVIALFGVIVPALMKQSPTLTPMSTQTETTIAAILLPTAIPTDSFTYTPQPTETATLVPSTLTFTPSVTVTSTPQPTNIPTATFTLLPPTATQTDMVSQIDTIQPTATPQPTNTVSHEVSVTTSPTVTLAFCEGTVISRFAGTTTLFLYSVPSNRAQSIRHIEVGTRVSILETAKDEQRADWYKLSDLSKNYLGWLPADNVRTDSSCA